MMQARSLDDGSVTAHDRAREPLIGGSVAGLAKALVLTRFVGVRLCSTATNLLPGLQNGMAGK